MKKEQKIVLLGYMASGKSLLGKALAEAEKLPFIDLDDHIAEKEEMTISELFSNKGEDHFRIKEKKHLKNLLKEDRSFVLSLGGGTPQIKGVMKLINKNSISFYLKASVETLFNRLAPQEVERPILTDITEDFLRDYIKMHLKEREEYYKKADHQINTNSLSIEEIIEMIKEHLQS